MIGIAKTQLLVIFRSPLSLHILHRCKARNIMANFISQQTFHLIDDLFEETIKLAGGIIKNLHLFRVMWNFYDAEPTTVHLRWQQPPQRQQQQQQLQHVHFRWAPHQHVMFFFPAISTKRTWLNLRRRNGCFPTESMTSIIILILN